MLKYKVGDVVQIKSYEQLKTDGLDPENWHISCKNIPGSKATITACDGMWYNFNGVTDSQWSDSVIGGYATIHNGNLDKFMIK